MKEENILYPMCDAQLGGENMSDALAKQLGRELAQLKQQLTGQIGGHDDQIDGFAFHPVILAHHQRAVRQKEKARANRQEPHLPVIGSSYKEAE